TNYTSLAHAPSTITSTIINNGTISGGFVLSGNGTNSGVLSADGGAVSRTLTLSGGWTLNDGSRLTAANGTINATGFLTIKGNVYADHLLIAGLSLTNAGTLHLAGPNAFTGSNFTNITGTLDFLPGASFDIATPLTLTNATLSGSGTLRVL